MSNFISLIQSLIQLKTEQNKTNPNKMRFFPSFAAILVIFAALAASAVGQHVLRHLINDIRMQQRADSYKNYTGPATLDELFANAKANTTK